VNPFKLEQALEIISDENFEWLSFTKKTDFKLEVNVKLSENNKKSLKIVQVAGEGESIDREVKLIFEILKETSQTAEETNNYLLNIRKKVWTTENEDFLCAVEEIREAEEILSKIIVLN